MLIFKRLTCSKFNSSCGAKIQHSFVVDLVKTASRFCSSICGSNEKVSKSVWLQLETWSLNKPWQLQMVQAFISKVSLILIQILTELEHISISIFMSLVSRIQESEFCSRQNEICTWIGKSTEIPAEIHWFLQPASISRHFSVWKCFEGLPFLPSAHLKLVWIWNHL